MNYFESTFLQRKTSDFLEAMKSKDVGGQLATNFRPANLAEGFAIQLIRAFAAVAPTPREEDHGIDLIGTLLRDNGKRLSADMSFFAQIKTRTAAHFTFEGEGITWLKNLRLPYFPAIMDLNCGNLSLYTLNDWNWVLHTSLVHKYIFVPDELMEDDPGDEYFPLGDPLITLEVKDCVHPKFRSWVFQVLKPVIEIEAENALFGPTWRFVEIDGHNYKFSDFLDDNFTPPRRGQVKDIAPGDTEITLRMLAPIITAFTKYVTNTKYNENIGDTFLSLRDNFRKLGFDPDPSNNWDEIAKKLCLDEQ